jgi:two-component sensor histidine kinase
MATPPSPNARRKLALLLDRRRILFTLGISLSLGLLLSGAYQIPTRIVLLRAAIVGIVAMLAFGAAELWPRRLPRWLARWALQILGVMAAIPFATLLAYWLTTGGQPNFATDPNVQSGFALMTVAGLLIAPWIAVAAMVHQREAFAQQQALAFELERSELERQALDARYRLLHAQVEPHFLFNTLANVQALIDSGSPQASRVLRALTEYLRAAVPRLREPATTLAQELELVRAYLELMHMRMPDRLQFSVEVDPDALPLRCPPMTVLTLVENAVRHGIDPAEQGGRIDITVRNRAGRCAIRVQDTGVGLGRASAGLGTGLATLRERLQSVFGSEATLQLTPLQPHGTIADVSFPARVAHA